MKSVITAIASSLLLTAVVSPVKAATVFSENFEAYAPGSNLHGQGGWLGSNPGGGSSVININPGTYLTGSLVADGQNPGAGIGWFNNLGHAIPALDLSMVTTLRIEAFMTSSPQSVNTGIGFGTDPTPFGASGLSVYWSVGAAGWAFDTRAVGGTNESVGGAAGLDELVVLEIVIDGPANEVHGSITSATLGTQAAATQTISDGSIQNLDAVEMWVDNNGRVGGEYDNLNVEEIPEPSTALLAGLGGFVLLSRRRRRGGKLGSVKGQAVV